VYKLSDKIFIDKINLIFEYNKKTPLFVRIANSEIEKNNLESAIGILKNGLKDYPDFAVAYFLLGRVLTLSGDYSQALNYFKTGSELIHSKSTYEYYLNYLNSVKSEKSIISSARLNSFEDEFSGQVPAKSDLQTKADSESDSSSKSIEERLDELARQLSKAKIDIQSESTANIDSLEKLAIKNPIVSETLAKIYIAQREYSEAIKVYEQLIIRHPEKKQLYEDRIREIRENSFY
jgi:tetratricopeptide (TPR) repeat protein